MSSLARINSQKIRTHLSESAKVKEQTILDCTDSVVGAVNLILKTFKSGKKILICGNGGSAADSQHFAGEFVCLLNKDFPRPALPAIALTTDSSILTAYANDFGFAGGFARQVEALGKPGDLLFGISTSGNSDNVIQALKIAKSAKIKTVALTGATGGQMKKIADVTICVPSKNTQYIQETHIAIEHLLCGLIEDRLFKKDSKNGH